jgi:hypothetical protein
LTSQWLLTDTLVLLYTVWSPRLSFEISMDPLGLHISCILHTSKQASCSGFQCWSPTCTVEPGPTWALASAASECPDGWPWENEFQGDNSLGGKGKQRPSGLSSHNRLWKRWAFVANTSNSCLGSCNQEYHSVSSAGQTVLKASSPKWPEQNGLEAWLKQYSQEALSSNPIPTLTKQEKKISERCLHFYTLELCCLGMFWFLKCLQGNVPKSWDK